MMKRNRSTFFCFSPPVMIATVIIEVGLTIYVLWRYKMNVIARIAVALLIFLAVFQLAEFMVCKGIGGDSLMWSRIGFAAITTLPPLALHLVYAVAKAKKRPLLVPAYVVGAGFLLFFLLVGRSIDGHACLGNYVIFQIAPGFGLPYSIYYYGLLLLTLGLGLYFLHRTKQKKARRALSGVMFGYSIFLIPTTAAAMANPETMAAIPSIMCGFAVLLALVLGLIVLPSSAKTLLH